MICLVNMGYLGLDHLQCTPHSHIEALILDFKSWKNNLNMCENLLLDDPNREAASNVFPI